MVWTRTFPCGQTRTRPCQIEVIAVVLIHEFLVLVNDLGKNPQEDGSTMGTTVQGKGLFLLCVVATRLPEYARLCVQDSKRAYRPVNMYHLRAFSAQERRKRSCDILSGRCG